eukprot:TRINITY_DN1348_c0_g1_i1.p1 TRINITY_DN1348_c0_g1~~TRINITY_DN1348_c0_g1_i1.p1  ORF type:complete len:190 (+),score=17.92 TRINITY_DN1348_c0_g1_i1:153-722(+)
MIGLRGKGWETWQHSVDEHIQWGTMLRKHYEIYSTMALRVSGLVATTSVMMGGFSFRNIHAATEERTVDVEVAAFAVLMCASLSASIVPFFATYITLSGDHAIGPEDTRDWFKRNVLLSSGLCGLSMLLMILGMTLLGISIAVEVGTPFASNMLLFAGVFMLTLYGLVVTVYFVVGDGVREKAKAQRLL